MKRVGLLLAIWMVVGAALYAQGCDMNRPAWSSPGAVPTFLELIIGSDDRLAPSVWAKIVEAEGTNPDDESTPISLLRAGQPAKAQALLAPAVLDVVSGQLRLGTAPDSTINPDQRNALEFSGLAAIMELKPQDAIFPLELALQFPSERHHCRIRTELLLARYLIEYGTQAPIFPHFNGGFFNYLQDSLGWKADAPDPLGYLIALNVVAETYRIDRDHGPMYLELLGDLLSHEPNAFNANYLSAIAYLRAAQLLTGDAQDLMDRKALYALEAPRQVEERFNQYRFTQLKKALQADADSAATMQQQYATEDDARLKGGHVMDRLMGGSDEMITTGFLETGHGRLTAMLARSKSQLSARAAEDKRYAGDVDLKAVVKKDNRFNSFALFLIGSIILAAIVIWRKLLVASRSQVKQ